VDFQHRLHGNDGAHFAGRAQRTQRGKFNFTQFCIRGYLIATYLQSKMLALRRSSSIRISISSPRESNLHKAITSSDDSKDCERSAETNATIVHFQTAIPTQDVVAIKQAEERLQ
jgi:hypothetical protein